MTVAKKLSGAFGLLVVLLVGLLVYHVRTTRAAVSTSYRLSELSARLYFSSKSQVTQLALIEESATKFRITRDPGYLRQFHDALDGFDAGLRDLAARSLGRSERAEVVRLAGEWGEVRANAMRFGAGPFPDRRANRSPRHRRPDAASVVCTCTFPEH